MSRSKVIAIARTILMAAVLWAVMLGLGRALILNAGWPLWAVALLAAVAAEVIWQLYRYERGTVNPARGRWLVGLRLAALGVLVWILLEPVWSRRETRDLRREVIFVWDESGSMQLIDEGTDASRHELVERGVRESGLRERLEEGVKVRDFRVARGVLDGEEQAGAEWDESTDLVGGLEAVLEQVTPDRLAGVVLLSDGRHNRAGRVEDVARRFGILDAPIGVVAAGSEQPPRDVSLLSVNAPDAVYLGDRVRVRAVVKVDGYPGETVAVRLWRGEEMAAEREIRVTSESHREEIRFQDVPEAHGVDRYRVEVQRLPDERFEENNEWVFETAVTRDRANVLLIESHPRWEFRYLRNLFYGRDKSIHLQYVLEHPERVRGQVDPAISASAGREFGDARATRLPRTEEEWRKFDVILLGDVGPGFITPEIWRIIQGCVTERGAMLGILAGPRSMPHAHRAQAAVDLLPVSWTPGDGTFFEAVPDFRMQLTAAGGSHPITAQSDSPGENESLWAGFPELRWRHPAVEVKPGAEVLLYAERPRDAGARPVDAGQLGAALEALAARQKSERDQAVLVVNQAGMGKVAALLTDRTWRLREGVGDVYHHRFWGQLVRWGAGPNLRGGSGGARIGTERLGYTADERVTITARLRDERMTPLMDEDLEAELWRDGRRVSTVELTAVENSAGLYEAKAGPLEEGNYEIRLVGDRVSSLVGDTPARVNISVGRQGIPVELAETTRNSSVLESAAELSGGRVVEAADAGQLADLFVRETVTREELRETRLWDWWLLVPIFAALTIGEWSLRKNSGLP